MYLCVSVYGYVHVSGCQQKPGSQEKGVGAHGTGARVSNRNTGAKTDPL